MAKYSNLDILSGGPQYPGSVKINKIEKVIEGSSDYFVFVDYPDKTTGVFSVENKKSEQEVMDFLNEKSNYDILDPAPVGKRIAFTNELGRTKKGLCVSVNYIQYTMKGDDGTTYYCFKDQIEVLE